MVEIAVVDYDIGNIRSIMSAFEKANIPLNFSRDYDRLLSADGLVLPGVGAFSHGMSKLSEYSMDKAIIDFASTGKPILGICLGMQLLFTQSDEFEVTNGLNLIPGQVVELELNKPEIKKLPHVGWNDLELPEGITWEGTILENIKPKSDMYFVHSYMAIPANKKDILSVTTYSDNVFCSAVHHNNIYGCQFHPEKSAEEGLKIVDKFVQICGEKNNDRES